MTIEQNGLSADRGLSSPRSTWLSLCIGSFCVALAAGCEAPPEMMPAPQTPTTPQAPTTAMTSQAPGAALGTSKESSPKPSATETGTPSRSAILQAELEKATKNLQSPGMVMAVQIGDEAPWFGAAGVRDMATREPMGPGDQFRIGSLTKNFIGVCVLQLIGEHKMALDDTLEKWLPKAFKNIDGTKITMRHLLTHTSGIENYLDDYDAWFLKVYQTPPGHTFNAPADQIAFADAVHKANEAKKAAYKLGEFHYSNTNYILLAMIATKAAGLPSYDWPRLVKDRILDPLGLKETVIPATGQMTIPDTKQHAYINWYNVVGGNPSPCPTLSPVCSDKMTEFTQMDMSLPWSAGAIISTAGDLLKLFRAEMKGTLLTPELRALQQTFIPTSRPSLLVGLSVFHSDPYGFIGHRGDVYGFNAAMQYQKEKDVMIIVLSNRTLMNTDTNDVVPESVFAALYPGESKSVPSAAPVPAHAAPAAKGNGPPAKLVKGDNLLKEY